MQKKLKIKKVKQGKEALYKVIKKELAKKGVRLTILINHLAMSKNTIIWKPSEVDEIALEMRHLAFQIKALQNAKTAVLEA